MSNTSAIEWTDATWNPVTGCSKVSPGCAHCYAEGVADRFWATQYPPIPITDGAEFETVLGRVKIANRPRAFTDVQCHEDRLDQPLRWKTPRRIFVNSMSDLFHEDVPDAFIDRVFAVMALAPQHTFQILTKRAERMRDYLSAATRHEAIVAAMDMPSWLPAGRRFLRVPENWPMPNVWLGVSVENPLFLKRLDDLMETPAAIRFVSLEPLLADVGDVSRWLGGREARQRMNRAPLTQHGATTPGESFGSAAGNVAKSQLDPSGAGASSTLPTLDWVIVGGESGTDARPCDLAWVRSIVKQCQAAGVPVFVKQLGAWPLTERFPNDVTANGIPLVDGPAMAGNRMLLRDRKGGDPDEWPADLRVREFPRSTSV
jgi:protein gp37